MIFEKIKAKGLAHLSYLVGSGDDAAVIDPRRDFQIYLDIADREQMRIRYVFETHRNEDYVIGSLEIAEETGARILHGEQLDFQCGEPITDGQEFPLGKLMIRALHTPGHTKEHMSYVLLDPELDGQPLVVFTGDVLFVGDTGRIDFYGKEQIGRMASMLYHSIIDKILPLGDGVILAPAHGQGSVCGGAISSREFSTVGIERATNPALQVADEEGFVRMKRAERHDMPKYFRMMEKLNQEGSPPLRDLPSPVPLDIREFRTLMEAGAMVIDTRAPPAFAGAFISGSHSIWIEGIPSFAGCVLPYDRDMILVIEDAKDMEGAEVYLRRIGYDRIKGYLNEGVENWIERGFPTDHLGLLTVHELKAWMGSQDPIRLLDVRSAHDFDAGHIEGAMNIYCAELAGRMDEVPRGKPIAVMCNVGYRSTLSASLLHMNGFEDIYVVLEGTKAWTSAGFKMAR